MKKVLVLILTFIMLFSFTACGKLTATDGSLTATVSSRKVKKLTITIKGDVADCEVMLNYTGSEEGEKYFDIEEKSVSANKRTFTVKGWNSGMSTFSIFLQRDDEVVGVVSGRIEVYEGLKMQCQDLAVTSNEFLELKGETDENISIPIYSGQNDILDLKGELGYWSPVDVSGAAIDVQHIGVIKEGYDRFQIVPYAAGNVELLFANHEENKQLRIKYTITGETSNFTVTAVDYNFEEYSEKEAAERNGKGAYETLALTLDPNFKLPEDYVIDSMLFFNYSTYETYGIDDAENFDVAKIPDFVNSLSIEAKCKDSTFEYVRTGATTVEKEVNVVEEIGQITNTQELNYGDRTVKLYTFEKGFNIALWESEGKVYKVTFMGEDPTGENSQSLLDEMLLK